MTSKLDKLLTKARKENIERHRAAYNKYKNETPNETELKIKELTEARNFWKRAYFDKLEELMELRRRLR